MNIDKPDIRVLVVDNWPEYRDLFHVILGDFGYSQIKTAIDGPEALAEAREYKPNLVLMETGIPGYGPTVCSQMRQEDYGKDAAIIGTAHPEYNTVWEAEWIAAGADDFFVKDMLATGEGRNDLDAKIQKALAKYQQ